MIQYRTRRRPPIGTGKPAADGVDWFVGLDLGQSMDPTALAVLRRTATPDDQGEVPKDHRGRRIFAYACTALSRFALGTPYPEIVARVKALLSRPEFTSRPYLAIDATGCGRPVVDMILNEEIPAEIHPITITSGSGEPRRDPWNNSSTTAYWVSKNDVVGAAQWALSSSRIRVAEKLGHAETLKKELLNFKIKITAAANETFSAREGAHDDLVLAVALALWLGDESDYRLQTIAGAVAVPGSRPNLVKDGIARAPDPAADPNDQWNRRGRHDDLADERRTVSNHPGLAGFRDGRRRKFNGR